jgi:hypothetical protein
MVVTANETDEPEDLSGILRHVAAGKYPKTRAEMANNRKTREFLEIGLDILREDHLDHCGPVPEQASNQPLFQSLSRPRILQRAVKNHLTEGEYTYRWEHKNGYTEDLIAYIFRINPQMKHIDNMATEAEVLSKGISFTDLVEAVAESEWSAIIQDPLSQLQAIISSALPSHPRVREYFTATYEKLLPRWADIYEQISTSYGITLQPGVQWHDLAILFNTVIEGAAFRAHVEGVQPCLSTGKGVLVSAIFAMLPSLLVSPSGAWNDLHST